MPTVSATWPAYEHVNVQVGLDAWLAGDPGGRSHEVYGITGIGFMRHMEIVGVGDFLLASGDSAFRSAGAGGVMTEALPSGPDGQTRACVSYGVYLVHDGGARLAMVLQPVSRGPRPEVILQIAGADQAHLDSVQREIRRLTSERSVFRGQVISFGPEMFGLARQAPMEFLDRDGGEREVPGGVVRLLPDEPDVGRVDHHVAVDHTPHPLGCRLDAYEPPSSSVGHVPTNHPASAGIPAGSWPAASTSSAASCCTARRGPARHTRCGTSSASCPR